MNFLRKLFYRPPESALRLGRNDNCWCGSGKKYKQCHQAKDARYFFNKRGSGCGKTG